MKRIIILLVILSLLSIAILQYLSYRRYHLSGDYDYKVSTDIDAAYYDPKVVLQYYETAYRIGSFAREAWVNEGVDVKFPDKEKPQSISASATYNQLRVLASSLEARLKASRQLKQQGYSNEQIQQIETLGISAAQWPAYQLLNGKNIQKGELSAAVWELQKILYNKGYKIPVDGKFAEETDAALKEFQQKQTIYPSGVVDAITLKALLSQK